eukprot:4584586-Amphidinium_carterae.1
MPTPQAAVVKPAGFAHCVSIGRAAPNKQASKCQANNASGGSISKSLTVRQNSQRPKARQPVTSLAEMSRAWTLDETHDFPK